jgi:hypothetical protein
MNVLFLCSRNRLRSPTAERVFADWPGVETASAGLAPDAESPLTAELLAWADLVALLQARVPKHLRPSRCSEASEGLREGIARGERAIAEGQVVPHEVAKRRLRRWTE